MALPSALYAEVSERRLRCGGTPRIARKDYKFAGKVSPAPSKPFGSCSTLKRELLGPASPLPSSRHTFRGSLPQRFRNPVECLSQKEERGQAVETGEGISSYSVENTCPEILPRRDGEFSQEGSLSLLYSRSDLGSFHAVASGFSAQVVNVVEGVSVPLSVNGWACPKCH